MLVTKPPGHDRHWRKVKGGSAMEALTRRTALTMGGASVLAGIGAAAALERGLWPGDGRPRFRTPGTARETIQQRHLPNVPLVTHDGRKVRFYDDLVRDKKVVLTFFSSRALTESYKVTQSLATLQRLFGAGIGKDMFVYSIARNPERDTPAALRNWAAQSGAGPGWTFPSGRPSDVATLRRGLGFTSDDPGRGLGPALRGGNRALRQRARDALGALPVAGQGARARALDGPGLRRRHGGLADR